MRKAPPPLRFVFSTNDDQRSGRRLTFNVLERDLDKTTRYFSVVPESAGCITVSFDPRPGSEEHVAVVQSIKHDTACAQEGLPRKYGTRAMILGALNALKDVSRERYPHLQTIELNDEAEYPCPPYAVKEDGKIKTFATDLLLRGETYYERYLGVRPRKKMITDIVDGVKARVRRPPDVSFSDFWKVLVGEVALDTERRPEQVRWLHEHEGKIRELFKKHGRESWLVLFRALFESYNCTFFACCWWRLCILFNMTRLAGATWYVTFADLPEREYTYISSKSQGGGGRNTAGKRKGERDAVADRADRTVRDVIKRKLRGRPMKGSGA